MLISTSTLVIISVGRLLQRGIDPWIMGAVLRFRPCFRKKKKKKPKDPVLYTTMEGFCFLFSLQLCDIKKLAKFSKICKISELTLGEKEFPKIPQDFVQKTTKFVRKIHCNHCGSNCFLKIITFIAPVVLRFFVPLYVGSFKTCWSNN